MYLEVQITDDATSGDHLGQISQLSEFVEAGDPAHIDEFRSTQTSYPSKTTGGGPLAAARVVATERRIP